MEMVEWFETLRNDEGGCIAPLTSPIEDLVDSE